MAEDFPEVLPATEDFLLRWSANEISFPIQKQLGVRGFRIIAATKGEGSLRIILGVSPRKKKKGN